MFASDEEVEQAPQQDPQVAKVKKSYHKPAAP